MLQGRVIIFISYLCGVEVLRASTYRDTEYQIISRVAYHEHFKLWQPGHNMHIIVESVIKIFYIFESLIQINKKTKVKKNLKKKFTVKTIIVTIPNKSKSVRKNNVFVMI